MRGATHIGISVVHGDLSEDSLFGQILNGGLTDTGMGGVGGDFNDGGVTEQAE